MNAPGLAGLCLLAAALAPTSTAAADELRDPTRPPLPATRDAQAARDALPVLSAVLRFEGKRTAIVDGHLVREGSVIGNYTIESILEDSVRYRRANAVHELHLPHPSSTVKSPAAEPPRTPSGVEP
jgi:hypothetical protein